MGFWPFGGSKKSSSNDKAKENLLEKTQSEKMALRDSKDQKAPVRNTRGGGRNKEEPRKLSKTQADIPRANVPRNIPKSQAPMSDPFIGKDEKEQLSKNDLTPPPTKLYQQIQASQSSIGPDNFSAVPHAPTLYAKRSDFDPSIPRKKSSKRKAEDYAREREVRAMSSPVPIPKPKRPATYSGSGPLNRDTKDIPGGMNKRLQRPSSQVSLPLPDDIMDSQDQSHQSAFKIGMFSALSPRPTLKYDANPRMPSGKQPVRHQPVNEAIEEEGEDLPFSKKRIDNLADGLDSSALRELMERDRRRKERKKDVDRKKLERKLQRRADRQREEETRRERAEEYVSRSQADLRTRSAAEQIHDEGSPGPALDDDTDPAPLVHDAVTTEDPFTDPEPTSATQQAIRNPFEDEQEVDVMQVPTPEHEPGPPIPVKSALRTAGKVEQETEPKPSAATLLSPPYSPPDQTTEQQATSSVPALGQEATLDVAEASERDRRSSDQSSSQHPGSWTNFFRRGTRRKASAPDRGGTTPSEFSNTSRESFIRKQQQQQSQPQPAVFNAAQRTFRRSQSGTPQRTMSKFREDLPELPLSPPDSRLQSPEATAGGAGDGGGSSISSKPPTQSFSGNLDARSLATSSSIPTLDRGRPDSRLQSLRTGDGDVTVPESTGHMLSQSLASVDSEGSWLSGRPVKRQSGPTSTALRQSQSSFTKQVPGAFEAEDDGLADDEYLRSLSPTHDERRESVISTGRKPSSTLIDLQKEQDQEQGSASRSELVPKGKDETWHEGVARQATVVRQPSRAKSREGLLKDSQAEEGESSGAENGEDDDEPSANIPGNETVTLERARSVEYKGHVRHISAGSARLLDIRRSSTQLETPPQTPGLPRKANASDTDMSRPKA